MDGGSNMCGCVLGAGWMCECVLCFMLHDYLDISPRVRVSVVSVLNLVTWYHWFKSKFEIKRPQMSIILNITSVH